MSMFRLLRFNASQRRSFISSLFTATFVASVITVAASSILPCPARKNGIHSDGKVMVERRQKRWIEEKPPSG